MNSIKKGHLRVPGASLYYEISGSGPLLLMIAGGGGGGESFKQVARELANRYTVVTYDRRGFSRSLLDDPAQDIPLETQSEDARCLLAALATEPAYVFGSSAGALIGLDLVTHSPQQVRTLVAHEPPARYLLADDSASQGHLLDTYLREGAFAAIRQFAGQIGVNYDNREPGVELPQWGTQNATDAESFFRYTLSAVQQYRLNIPALLAAPTRLVIAGGSAGTAYLGFRCARAVATLLGTAVVEFPSHHAGYISHPHAFAERLHEILGERPGAERTTA